MMCGRYTLRRIDANRLGVAYPTPLFEEFTERPRFNVAPSQKVPIVRAAGDSDGDGNDGRVLALAAWGFVPAWAKEPPKVRPINARSETAATNGLFRKSMARRRCLIPADGFYEWRRDGDAKTPLYIHRACGEPYAFAGLWDRWDPEPGDDPAETCAILTASANDLMRPIHHRLPLVVPESAYDCWLDPDAPARDVAELLAPWSPDGWEAYPVSRRVNNPRNDSADLVEPAEKDGLF